MPENQNKTEKPTPKRRRELREKGQVARSQELPSVLIILLGSSAVYFSASFIYQKNFSMVHFLFGDARAITDSGFLNYRLFIVVTKIFLMMITPVSIAVFVAAIIANYMQVKGLFSVEAISPEFSKLNPINGFKQLFSLRSLAELAKSLAKLGIVSYVTYRVVNSERANLLPLFHSDLKVSLIYIGKVAYKIFYKTAAVMLILAVLDYFYQKWQFEKDQMMTKEEVKEEFKQIEGNPMIKARIRSLQKSMARKRMMSAVPEADVIITNPTRIAVALQYKSDKMDAPKVIAKGMRRVAERIKEIGKKHGVPIIENKPLAQTLYKEVEIDQRIPVNLYQAVAKILAYIYQMKNKRF